MFDFHEKRKIKSIVYSKPVAAVLVIAAIALSFSVYDRYIVAQDIREKLEGRKEELKALEERMGALETRVDYLKNNRGVEEEIRNRFDVAKEGEQVVIILSDDAENAEGSSTPLTSQTNQKEKPQSFFERFKFWE